jgi:hypothetical protein
MSSILFPELKYLILIGIVPFTGFLLFDGTNNKEKKIIFIVSALLFLPVFTGYKLIIPWLYEFCLMLMLSIGFSYLLTKIKHKIRFSIIFLIFFLFFIGLIKIADSFQRIHTKTLKSWNIESYHISYQEGFYGRPLESYVLYDYFLKGLFKKEIDRCYRNINNGSFGTQNTKDTCLITFAREKVIFNKCDEKVIKSP